MPTPTHIPLATLTLTSTDTSIDFANIPNTYRDLFVVCRMKNNGSGTVSRWQFNGDTGANYSRMLVSMSGVVEKMANANQNYFEPHYYSDFGNSWGGSLVVNILDYSATDKHKGVLFRNNQVATERGPLMMAGRWANTNAITSIKISINTGAFDVGSTFSLYGIVS